MKRLNFCPAVAYVSLNNNRILRIANEHNHMPDLLKEAARSMEVEVIHSAAVAGNSSTIDVIARIKTAMERSEVPEVTTAMRKKRALSQAIRRERNKVVGGTSDNIITPEEIMERFPDKFRVSSTGEPFLRHLEYLVRIADQIH